MKGDKIRKILEDYSLITHCGTFPTIQSSDQMWALEELNDLLELVERKEANKKEGK